MNIHSIWLSIYSIWFQLWGKEKKDDYKQIWWFRWIWRGGSQAVRSTLCLHNTGTTAICKIKASPSPPFWPWLWALSSGSHRDHLHDHSHLRIVSPYHCDTGIEVDCNDNSAVFAHCFPSALLPLFLDGNDGCDDHDDGSSSPSMSTIIIINTHPHYQQITRLPSPKVLQDFPSVSSTPCTRWAQTGFPANHKQTSWTWPIAIEMRCCQAFLGHPVN